VTVAGRRGGEHSGLWHFSDVLARGAQHATPRAATHYAFGTPRTLNAHICTAAFDVAWRMKATQHRIGGLQLHLRRLHAGGRMKREIYAILVTL